jgi:hypothetical protein
MNDFLFQPVEVFKQPDAGTAMNGWNEEFNFAYSAVRKFDQAIPYLRMVKVSILLAELLITDLNAGMVFYVVILTGIAAFQDFIDGSASLAAKGLIVENHRMVPAIFTAMVTARIVAGVQNRLCVQVFRCSGVQVFRCSSIQVFGY